MNRYKNAPGIRGPTKATASTLCQKCLKRDIYECTVSAQERPYASRPSRTQQLQNPRLMPKLSSETPNDLLRTKGVADELLTKRDEERGRKRALDAEDMADDYGRSPKQDRSTSSHSMSSVSTISTNRSRSATPPLYGGRGANGRDRTSSVSPPPSQSRKRRHSGSSDVYSGSSYSPGPRHRSRSREWADDRNTRRRHREASPEERGRHRESGPSYSRRDHSRSRSMDRSRIAKGRHSMTPDITHANAERRSYRSRESPPGHQRPKQDTRLRPEQPRERSLSPYSKRLALTQAMNMGR